jgi:hypothetical protein
VPALPSCEQRAASPSKEERAASPIDVDLMAHKEGIPMSATTRTPSRKRNGRDEQTDQTLVRLNVNLNVETAAALRQIAEERDISFTEAVRRAISVYKFIDDETREGRRIQTTSSDRGDIRELVLM